MGITPLRHIIAIIWWWTHGPWRLREKLKQNSFRNPRTSYPCTTHTQHDPARMWRTSSAELRLVLWILGRLVWYVGSCCEFWVDYIFSTPMIGQFSWTREWKNGGHKLKWRSYRSHNQRNVFTNPCDRIISNQGPPWFPFLPSWTIRIVHHQKDQSLPEFKRINFSSRIHGCFVVPFQNSY